MISTAPGGGLAVTKLWIFEHEPPPVSGVIL